MMDHSMMDHSNMGHTMNMNPNSMNLSQMQQNSNYICDPSKMNMIMYMDGFHSILFSAKDSKQSCINLFFSSWTLDTTWKVLFAMVTLFILAFGMEGLSATRLNFFSSSNIDALGFTTRKKSMLIVLFHALQAFLGYMLMLGAMTFSLELLLSVCFGLAAGYYHFFAKTML